LREIYISGTRTKIQNMMAPKRKAIKITCRKESCKIDPLALRISSKDV
jgi:hypothetical protein